MLPVRPRDGRADDEIVELRLLHFELRAAGSNAGGQRVDGMARRLGGCLGHVLSADESLAPLQGRLGVAQGGLVLGDIGFGLPDLRLHQAIVEAEKRSDPR